MSCNYFPYDPSTNPKAATAMKNPAIQLLGNRFFSDQTHSELLIEFLLIIFSHKKFKEYPEFSTCLPSLSDISDLPGKIFQYAPKARLNLKLFSFLGATKMDARHKTHRDHHLELIQELKDRIEADSQDKEGVTRTLENLFLGFQGAGSGRGWCAQSFIPISEGFLGGETIWNITQAKKKNPQYWEKLTESQATLNTFFTMNKHRFLGRGGESLYLQLCNALAQPKSKIKEWADSMEMGLSKEEKDPEILHGRLEKEFKNFTAHCPAALTEIAEFIDGKLDADTPEKTDWKDWDNDEKRFVDAGWCRTESWQEGYIFAVELYRLLRAGLDVVDRIHLLEIACAMQVLRSLGAQTSRITEREHPASWPGYRLALSAPADDRPDIRRLSQISVKTMEKQIYQCLRSNHVTLPEDEKKKRTTLNQADKSYGGKLFIGLAKRIGLLIPKMGPGARFVLNERILRFLVITTVPLGGRFTLDTFKLIIENRHGLALDADGLDRAGLWMNGTGLYLPADTDQWLQQMLEAAGFLIQLSDSCALVSNPAEDIDKEV